VSFFDQISVLILTYNEARNIERTLDALSPFPEIVVVDSGSDDATLDIARRYDNVRAVTRPFDSHAAQWNYGVSICNCSKAWVLALDADYEATPALIAEIGKLVPGNETFGYRISFNYLVFGRTLSASLYPPVVALFCREKGKYIQQGHTQRLVVDGKIEDLRHRINHDDRKPHSRWFLSQQKYAALEAEHLLSSNPADLRPVDRIRRMGWLSPFLIFFYTLIVKGCIFDGWAGWLYVLQRTQAEMMITVEIVDRRLRR
jgi:glycosyltransferase involved in cell wall biosynthesis